MSAITGICDFRAIAGSASASSWLGHATRTMSQPEAVSSAICCRVALTSAVSVVVIDCTEMGASPPTITLPTLIWRLRRRGASTGGGAAGIPRETEVIEVLSCFWLAGWSADGDRGDQVAGDEHDAHQQQGAGDDVGDGQELRDV